MKYIVTNSLNIENILSTECISPASFYEQRRFGYRVFEPINELNKFSSILLLFSKIPDFKIVDSAREAFPMVIELDDEKQETGAKKVCSYKKCEVFVCGKTIRLTPNNCRLLFFTSRAMQLALLKCRDSKFCKMSDFVKFEVVEHGSVPLDAIVKKIPHKTIGEDELGCVNDDNSYDRARGFIYGYFIGTTKSLSPTTAKMLRIQKRVYNILASVKNNQGQIVNAFRDELSKLSTEYDIENPDVRLAKDKWRKLVEKYGTGIGEKGLLEFCNEIGVDEGEAKRGFIKKQGLCIPKLSSNFDGYALENYYSEICVHTASHIANDSKCQCHVDICKDLDGGLHDRYRVMMDNDGDADNLFNSILNRIVWASVIDDAETLRINRNDIATDVVNIVKGIIGYDQWTGSKEQQYFHHLRQNISNAEPFDLHEIDNIVYQSLAAFLLKGDDFDELVQYLENNAMPIYKYALALWGATVGYVRISRTITDALTQEQLEKLLKDTCRLLEGRDFDGNLCKTNNNVASEYDSVPSGKSRTENGCRESFAHRMVTTFYKIATPKEKKACSLSLIKACNEVLEENWNDYCAKVLDLLRRQPEWVKRNRREPKAVYDKLKKQLEKDLSTKQQTMFSETDESNKRETN